MNADCGMRIAEYNGETWEYYLRTPCPTDGRRANSKLRTQLGFTLIEVIVFIVLAGIILPLIFIPFMASLKSYGTPEVVSTATFLGEELMEEIKSKSFDDIIDGYNSSTVPLPGYSRSVTVSYVPDDTANPDLDNPVAGPTRFKRIQVTVTHSEIPDVELFTLVTSLYGVQDGNENDNDNENQNHNGG